MSANPVVSAASFFICWRAMGAACTRPSLRPLYDFEGDARCKARALTRRGKAKMCVSFSPYRLSCPASRLRQGFGVATNSTARRSFSGGGKRASSIPEAVVLEPIGRGVLDCPVKPGNDSSVCCLKS